MFKKNTHNTVMSPEDAETKKLSRILWIVVAFVGVLAVVFGVIYYLGQRSNDGPSAAERTITVAEKAVTDEPNNIGARLALAAAYTQTGRPDDALLQYKEVLKATPGNRSALLGEGEIYYSKNDLVNAAAAYGEVIKNAGGGEFSGADPQLQTAFFYAGEVALRQGDTQKAVKYLESAVQIDATDADAWNLIGEAQAKLGNFKKAAAAYQEALKFVPTGWCDPYAGLKNAYSKLGDKDGVAYATAMGDICNEKPEGAKQLEALVNGPYKVPAMLGLALAAETTGDYKTAVDWYKKVTAVEPQNVSALTALARLDVAPISSGSPAASAPAGSPSPAAS